MRCSLLLFVLAIPALAPSPQAQGFTRADLLASATYEVYDDFARHLNTGLPTDELVHRQLVTLHAGTTELARATADSLDAVIAELADALAQSLDERDAQAQRADSLELLVGQAPPPQDTLAIYSRGYNAGWPKGQAAGLVQGERTGRARARAEVEASLEAILVGIRERLLPTD